VFRYILKRLKFRYFRGLLVRGSAYRKTSTYRKKRTYIHPCPELDSNPRFQCSGGSGCRASSTAWWIITAFSSETSCETLNFISK